MRHFHVLVMLGTILFSLFFSTSSLWAAHNHSNEKKPCKVVKTLNVAPEQVVHYQPSFCHLGSDNYRIAYVHTQHPCQLNIKGKSVVYTSLPRFVGNEVLTIVACDDLGICDTTQTSIVVYAAKLAEEQKNEMEIITPKQPVVPAFSFVGVGKAGGFLQLGFTTDIEKIALTITDFAGLPVLQQALDTQSGYNIHQIKTAQLPVGLYSISLHNARKTITTKFLN